MITESESDDERIVGPEWDKDDACWYYTVAAPSGGEDWTLSVLPEERSKKVILTLWRGGLNGPADGREAMSDPINISESKLLYRYYESACQIFDDSEMAWVYEALEWLRKNHARLVKQQQEQRKREMQDRAERKIPGTPYYVEEGGGLGMEVNDTYVSIANFSCRMLCTRSQFAGNKTGSV